jgi:FtsZ-binding cell division protein ZapB
MSPEEAAIRERDVLPLDRRYQAPADRRYLLGVIDELRELNIKLMLELQEAHDERDDLAQQVVRLLDAERSRPEWYPTVEVDRRTWRQR